MLLKLMAGNSLAVQWLGLFAPTAEGPGSIPGWGTKIPKASQKKKKKELMADLNGLCACQIRSSAWSILFLGPVTAPHPQSWLPLLTPTCSWGRVEEGRSHLLPCCLSARITEPSASWKSPLGYSQAALTHQILTQWFSTGDIGQCLETFMVDVIGGMLLTPSGRRPGAWDDRPRQQRTIQPQMSVVPRLTDPALN